jgi:hypothetical protein
MILSSQKKSRRQLTSLLGALYEKKMKDMGINHLRYRLFCQKRSKLKTQNGQHINASFGSRPWKPNHTSLQLTVMGGK